MKPLPCFWQTAILLSVLMLTSCIQSPVIGQEGASVTFRFAPEVPLAYEEEVVTRSLTVASSLDPAEETARIRNRVTIEREGQGYRVMVQPQSFSLTKGGEPKDDPVMAALQQTKITYHLNAEGKLESIEGYEETYKAVKDKAPKEMRPMLAVLLNDKTLASREKTRWNAQTGDLLGKTATRNDTWIGQNVFSLPNGDQARYYVVSVYRGLVEKEGRKLARIAFFFTSDIQRIQQSVNDIVHEPVKDLPKPPGIPPTPGFTISGEGERLVDPNTMITREETSSRSIQVMMDTGNDTSTPVLIQEDKTTRVHPPGAAAAEAGTSGEK